MTPQQLADRAAIIDTVSRYCRAVDRMDRDLMTSCFHPDAVDTHGSFAGTRDEYLDWVFPLLESYDSTFHFIGQVLVELDGDDARSEAYGIAHHRTAGGTDRQNLVTGFRFVDEWQRRDAVWRISRRTAITDWSRVDHEADWWPAPPHLLQGQRSPADPSYGN